MLNKVNRFITTNQLFNKNEYIICAVSGGVDSICLLDVLKKLDYKVVLAHVNHHKRPESEQEAKAMANLAKDLKIPFELLNYYADKNANFQDQARKARYAFFKDLTQKYQTRFIATAHHLNDQAETILMRIASGSNLYGYGGIAVDLELADVEIVRPLLCVTKEEIYNYAKENNLGYFEDSSNKSDDYLRNRIRHNIVPKFQELNADILNKFQEYSIQIKEAFNFIRKQSIKYLDELNNNIRVSSFNKLDIALKKDILCLLFERYNLEKNNDLINKCLLLISNAQNKNLDLKGDLIFSVEYDLAKITKQKQTRSYCEFLTLDSECFILNKYHFYFSKKIPQNNANYLKLCYNNLKLPLKIRNRNSGDFIKMSYGNKKVARIMIDAKVSNTLRKEIPLVFDAEKNLLWIYNLAKSEIVTKQKANGDIFLVCEEINNG